MAGSGLGRALLVQPSFLGTDNTYMQRAVSESAGRFVCVVVVDTETTVEALVAFAAKGAVGVRLNLIGSERSFELAGLAARLAQAGVFLQIQAEAAQWRHLAAQLPQLACPVVIDHFGRTRPDDPSGGFRCLLRAAAASDAIWFKLSAPYRGTAETSRQCAAAMLKCVGPDRLMWGSDWPWTQFEGRFGYPESLGWLSEWVQDEESRQVILCGGLPGLIKRAILSRAS